MPALRGLNVDGNELDRAAVASMLEHLLIQGENRQLQKLYLGGNDVLRLPADLIDAGAVEPILEAYRRRRTSPGGRQFKVGITYAKETRDLMSQVAEILAKTLDKDRILFDLFLEAHLAGVDQDIALQKHYSQDTDLIVVVLSAEYADRPWCINEWRAIRPLIGSADDSRIMLLKYGERSNYSEIGIMSGDIPIDVTERAPDSVAQLILKRFDSMLSSRSLHPLNADLVSFQSKYDTMLYSLMRYPYLCAKNGLSLPRHDPIYGSARAFVDALPLAWVSIDENGSRQFCDPARLAWKRVLAEARSGRSDFVRLAQLRREVIDKLKSAYEKT